VCLAALVEVDNDNRVDDAEKGSTDRTIDAA